MYHIIHHVIVWYWTLWALCRWPISKPYSRLSGELLRSGEAALLKLFVWLCLPSDIMCLLCHWFGGFRVLSVTSKIIGNHQWIVVVDCLSFSKMTRILVLVSLDVGGWRHFRGVSGGDWSEQFGHEKLCYRCTSVRWEGRGLGHWLLGPV